METAEYTSAGLVARGALPGRSGAKHLDGTDRYRRRKRSEPFRAVEDAQRLRQRSQRGAFASLEILDGVQRDARTFGELALIQILS